MELMEEVGGTLYAPLYTPMFVPWVVLTLYGFH